MSQLFVGFQGGVLLNALPTTAPGCAHGTGRGDSGRAQQAGDELGAGVPQERIKHAGKRT